MTAQSASGDLGGARLGVGVTLWLASEAMFFASLFGAYFVLRGAADVWPPDGVSLDVARSAIFTLVLVASSGTIVLAERRLDAGDLHGAVRLLTATIALGAIFLGNQVLEYGGLGFSISSHPYGSMYILLTGFHGLHVLGGLLLLGLLTWRIATEGHAGARRLVMAGSMYWHFVDVVWIALFATLFLLR